MDVHGLYGEDHYRAWWFLESQDVKRAVIAGVLAGVVSTLLVLAGTPIARAAETTDPAFVGWSDLLPSLTSGYDPNSDNECVAGKLSCVDKVIKEMRRRFEPLGKACDHNAVFGLAYLRTTQTYRWAAAQGDFFQDTPYVNHEDAVFAKYYFDAYDAWSKGDRANTPAAWQIAFDAAQAKQTTGSGDLFLGMSAHVNRDLPFVLASIGLVAPDGSSRKADHDKVNQFLNMVISPLMAEADARFDSEIDGTRDPQMLGFTSTFQMLEAWRETAWRNAERLANAPDAAARAQVAQSIEDYAEGVNATLAVATSYAPPFKTTAARDTWCASHKGDPAPIAYVFGTPSAW